MISLVILSAAVVSCSKKENPNVGGLQIFFEEESYSVKAGESVTIPFTINGSQGYVLDVTAESSDADLKVKTKVDPEYTGTITVTASDVVLSAKTVEVVLTVKDDANKRSKTGTVEVNIGKSADMKVCLVGSITSFKTWPGKQVTLTYAVTGLGSAKKTSLDVTIPSEWKPTTPTWDENTASGVVTVTTPSVLPGALPVKIEFKDDLGRTAVFNESIPVVEAIQTANCYIVAPGGSISIKALKGNSKESLSFDAAELVWQDAAGMVKSVAANTAASTIDVVLNSGKQGNAVVAAKDGGKIVWSWHLWVTNFNPETNPFLYINDKKGTAYTMMDRELGAMGCTKFGADALGCYYQWGRKDPFAGVEGTTSSVQKKMYDINGNEIYMTVKQRPTYSDNTTTNLQLAIETPLTFYTAPSSAWPVVDWLTDKASLQDHDLWGGVSNEKTIYDPCPFGWMMPEYSAFDFRNQYKKEGKLNDSKPYDPSYPWYIEYEEALTLGFRYKTTSGKEFWFPFSGKLDVQTGAVTGVGGGGNYYTRTTSNTLAVDAMVAWGNPASEGSLNRPYGFTVRCVKE